MKFFIKNNGDTIPEKGWSFSRNIYWGILAAILFVLSWVSLLMVLIGGYNPQYFYPVEIIQFTIFLLSYYLIFGILIGLAVGTLTFLVSRIKSLTLQSIRIPWILFVVIFLIYLVWVSINNSYIFKTYSDINSMAIKLMIVFVFTLIIISFAIIIFKPSKVVFLLFCGIFLILMSIVFPFSLTNRSGDKNLSTMNASSDLYKPTGCKVVLVGLDGASWNIADQLIAEGKMPNLASLIQKGTRAFLNTFKPTDSPLIWTTIVTGKAHDAHGINSFVSLTVPFTMINVGGLRIPTKIKLEYMTSLYLRWLGIPQVLINNSFRREKALWNILGEFGIKSAVINWWASSPVEKIPGLVVSDEIIFFPLLGKGEESKKKILTYPPNLIEQINRLIISPEQVNDDDYLRFLNVTSDELAGMKLDNSEYHGIFSILSFCIRAEESMGQITFNLMEKYHDIPLWLTYFKGIDMLSHVAMKYSPLVDDPHISMSEKNKIGGILEEIYREDDELLGKIISLNTDPDTIFIVLSDHGFANEDASISYYGHNCAPKGIIGMAGGPILKGAEFKEPSVFDITPTILYLLGLPIAKDMPGRIMTEVIDPSFLHENPIRTIESYGSFKLVPAEEENKEINDQMKGYLKALGYIK